MKLREYEGKALFKKYGIEIPSAQLIKRGDPAPNINKPVVLKAQVLSGDRKKRGGIIFSSPEHITSDSEVLFSMVIEGEEVEQILVDDKVDIEQEYYASISYDTNVRGPVLAISKKGGSGIAYADIYPLDITLDSIPEEYLAKSLSESGFKSGDVQGLGDIVQKLWKLFLNEFAILAEINPIFKTRDGRFIAGDAKVIIDNEKVNPNEKPFVSMGGDIAILASGGGASMLNIDSLLEYGGNPANYAEYSGNPKAGVVKDLTKKVLEQKGINGLWVIGNTANFTDIYETLSGFLEGLQSLEEKPKYPILIRRDGPRGNEAREMVKKFAKDNGYDIHVYGGETPMHESARMIVQLVNKYKQERQKRL